MIEFEIIQDESGIEPLAVANATYIRNHIIDIEFSDGLKKEIDFEKYLFEVAKNPMETDYQDLAKFKKFDLVDNNVDWDDGTMIFHVEDLHSGVIFA